MIAENLIQETVTHFPELEARDIHIAPVEKGGSDRKFYRIRVGPERSLILVKYGSERDENRHYVDIARFLDSVGVSVPKIYFHDEAEGLIWMEDLGESDLWSFRDEPWTGRRQLYCTALDQAVALHARAHRAAPEWPLTLQVEFNAALYKWEQNYFFENCLGRVFQMAPDTFERGCNRHELDSIADSLAELPRVLVHRDLQSQNIMILGDRAAFIDFQGLRPGLPQYDLASLLYDPYVALTDEERAELLDHYRAAANDAHIPLSDDFDATFLLCAMQRLMQALGAYGFLGLVKGRARFLDHVPAALASLRAVCEQIPRLDSLRTQLAKLRT